MKSAKIFFAVLVVLAAAISGCENGTPGSRPNTQQGNGGDNGDNGGNGGGQQEGPLTAVEGVIENPGVMTGLAQGGHSLKLAAMDQQTLAMDYIASADIAPDGSFTLELPDAVAQKYMVGLNPGLTLSGDTDARIVECGFQVVGPGEKIYACSRNELTGEDGTAGSSLVFSTGTVTVQGRDAHNDRHDLSFEQGWNWKYYIYGEKNTVTYTTTAPEFEMAFFVLDL